PVVAAPTAPPPPAGAARQSVAATPTPIAVPTAIAVFATQMPGTSTPVAAPTPRPTISPELTAVIGDAYQEYWQVRAEALYDLDASRLQEVMAGDHLAAVQERIDELRADGHAIQTDVDHKYVIVEATDDNAKLVDTYVDQSF